MPSRWTAGRRPTTRDLYEPIWRHAAAQVRAVRVRPTAGAAGSGPAIWPTSVDLYRSEIGCRSRDRHTHRRSRAHLTRWHWRTTALFPILPTESIVDCLRTATSFMPEVIIGMGGGSCMDMAKAVAVLVTHGGEPSSYYGEYKVPWPGHPAHRGAHDIGHRLRGDTCCRGFGHRQRHKDRHRQPAPHSASCGVRSRADVELSAGTDCLFRRRRAHSCHRIFHGSGATNKRPI